MEALLTDPQFRRTVAVCAVVFLGWIAWSLLAPIRPVDPPLHLDPEDRAVFDSVSRLPDWDEKASRWLCGTVAATLAVFLIGFLLWPVYARLWFRVWTGL